MAFSLTDDSGTHPRRTFPRWTLPRWTLPRQTFPRPDTSRWTLPRPDTSPTRHIPDGHFPDQTNSRQIFSWVDASHNGHFPDQLNTSNILRYLKKYIVRDNFGNIHAVVRTLEILLEVTYEFCKIFKKIPVKVIIFSETATLQEPLF